MQWLLLPLRYGQHIGRRLRPNLTSRRSIIDKAYSSSHLNLWLAELAITTVQLVDDAVELRLQFGTVGDFHP